MTDLPPPDDDHRKRDRSFVLRMVAFSLAAVIGTDVLLVLGKAGLCIWRGGCNLEEQGVLVEFVTGLLGTLVALLFGLLGK